MNDLWHPFIFPSLSRFTRVKTIHDVGVHEGNDSWFQQGMQDFKPVHIGSDVWIGTRVTILPGVKICNGCIIGANAEVT